VMRWIVVGEMHVICNNVEVLVKSSSSAVEHRSSNTGKSDGTADVHNPELFARRRTASIRWRSVGVVKPHQVRAAWVTFNYPSFGNDS